MPDETGSAGPDTTLTDAGQLDAIDAAEATADSNGHAPPSVFEDLRTQYAEAAEEVDRHITLQIRPGRFKARLAVRYGPGPWEDYRKRAQRAERKAGGGAEGNLAFMSQTMAACCQTILYRPTDQTELLPMDECNPGWRGTIVRFDERLCEAVGIEAPRHGEQQAREAMIARLLFQGNEGAMIEHFATLDAFLKEEVAGDEEAEDEGTGGRPT